MNWNETGIIAGFANINMPSHITAVSRKHYVELEQYVIFNSYHNVNSGAVESARNSKHMIIANCLYRREQ